MRADSMIVGSYSRLKLSLGLGSVHQIILDEVLYIHQLQRCSPWRSNPPRALGHSCLHVLTSLSELRVLVSVNFAAEVILSCRPRVVAT
jgi:hypothetical protein